MSTRNILVVQLRQLGDILLTTPCFREIKREVPDARITFLSHKMGRLIIEGSPFVDQHLVYDEVDSLSATAKLVRELRSSHFDMAFDFMCNPRSALLTVLSGSKQRIGFQSARSIFYTRSVPRPPSAEYIVREKFRLLTAAGFSPKDQSLLLPWTKAHVGPVREFLRSEQDLASAPYRVILSPTHRRENRKWPGDRYAALADRLCREWGAAVIWLWGPGLEKDEVLAMQAKCRERTWLAPPTGFREMAALIANMDLFIGNSNGPSHVAVAVDTCSLQLHGHTDIRAWCPLTARHRAIQSSEYGGLEATLTPISVEDVMAAANSLRAEIDASPRRGRALREAWNQ